MKPFYLTKALLIGVYLYLITLTLSSSTMVIYVILNINSDITISMQLLSIICPAVMASSVFYIKKLYLICFSQGDELFSRENQFSKIAATATYFISRPLFSGVIALVAYILYKSGELAIVKNGMINAENLLYALMAIGVCIGFTTGKSIKYIINASDKTTQNLSKSQGEER